MNRTICAALALAGALAAAACQGRPEPRDGFTGRLVAAPIGLAMTDFDADGDRSTARAELDAGVEASWRELDANGDGQGSAIEFADWSRAVLGADDAIPGRVAFDRDANGIISRAELAAVLEAEFARLDADADGAIRRAELVRVVVPEPTETEGYRRVIMQGPNGPDSGQVGAPE